MNIRLIVEYFLNHRQTLAVGIITTKTLMPPKLTNLSPAHSFRNLKVCLEPGILVSLCQLDLTNLTNFSIEFFVASQAHTLSIPSANYEKCFGQIKIQESFRTKRTLTDTMKNSHDELRKKFPFLNECFPKISIYFHIL